MTKHATKTKGDKIGSWTVDCIVVTTARNPEHTTFRARCSKPNVQPNGISNGKKVREFDVTSN